MNEFPALFLSNRVEALVTSLKSNLFLEGTSPFARRLIVVPSPSMRAWLLWQLARLGIAAGVRVVYLNQGLATLLNKEDSKKEEGSPRPLPSLSELALAIESKLRGVIESAASLTDEERQLWKPLQGLLEKDLSFWKQGRLSLFCVQVAHVFMQYGAYAGEAMSKWEELPLDACTHWQQPLWMSLFGPSGAWAYPYRQLNSVITEDESEGELQVHLFALSYLSGAQRSFFLRLGKLVPVYLYGLSPCQMFWADTLSKREQVRLHAFWEKKKIAQDELGALEEHLRDHNPLLANFGKLGRELMSWVDKYDIRSFESYALPVDVKEIPCYEPLCDEEMVCAKTGPLTLLKAIQTDILLLRNPAHSENLDFSNNDASFQVHVASSKMREVEILYETLLGVIDAHKDDESPVCPGDVLIMGPDIAPYAGVIKAVFGQEGSLLPFHIMDLSIAQENALAKGLLSLLALATSRFEVSSLLRVFDHLAFQRKHHLSSDELEWIRFWLAESGIRWGMNSEGCQDLLKRDGCSSGLTVKESSTTWEHGLNRLLLGLAMDISEEEVSRSRYAEQRPFRGLEFSQAETLGKLVVLVRSLYADVKCLQDGSQLSLEDWTVYLTSLFESYFEADVADSASLDERRVLVHHLHLFRRMSLSLGGGLFPFSSIAHHLELALEGEGSSAEENGQQVVRFCSMLPMRAVPAKVICLIGMDEESYPRRKLRHPLNLMETLVGVDYCPSSVDYDRYLFLEALLSTRECFVVSYQSHSAGDEELSPSLVVEELLDYVDQNYSVEGRSSLREAVIRRHPSSPFHKRYFQSDLSDVISYSHFNYQAALSFYSSKKEPLREFIPGTFSVHVPFFNSSEACEEVVIDLKSLSDAAKNPLKVYFNKTLGIYLDGIKSYENSDEESFALSSLESGLLRKEALRHSLDHVLELAEARGLIPIGVLGKVARDELADEVERLKKNLKKMSVTAGEEFSVELRQGVHEVTRIGERRWLIPPVSILDEGRQVFVVGTLPDIASQGLLEYGDGKEESAVKVWPKTLAFSWVRNLLGQKINGEVLFTKSGDVKPLFFDEAQSSFKNYLRYHATCLKEAVPVDVKWIPDIVKNDRANLEVLLQKALEPVKREGGFVNKYLTWLFKGASLPSAERVLSDFAAPITEAFGPVLTAWCSKDKAEGS